MADKAAKTPETEEAGVPGATPAPGARKKTLVLVAAAAVALAAAGAGGWWLLAPSGEGEEVAEIDSESLVDIPEMSVNLRTPDGRPNLVRVHLMLVPGTEDKERIEARLPLVIDRFQPFLRELRPEDIAGSAATFRLKEEMLVRSNAVLGKGAVRDVLVQDLVQQ